METTETSPIETSPISDGPILPVPPAQGPQDGQNAMGRWVGLAGALVVGIVLGPVVISGLAHITPSVLWSRLTGRSTAIDVSGPTIVEKIRQLSRLETVVYSLDKIVEGERVSKYVPDALVGDKLLLIANGEVIAGIDFGQLKPDDIQVNGDSVHVHLPPAQILTTRVDNGRTRVYSRTTGLFVLADPNLETETREAAEQQIAQAAASDGILDKAPQNARVSVTALLYGLGFKRVDVQ